MKIFKIATWNVNSLRVRLDHLRTWLNDVKPDVLAIQETKIIDDDFPFAALAEAGYTTVFSGQKTYNGVAILSRQPMTNIVKDIPELADPQRRVLCATIDGVRILNIYIPNGQSVGSEKYQYKLNWLSHLDQYLKQELSANPNMIILGDFNIAPCDDDVHDPKSWEGSVLVSEPERLAFQSMVQAGFQDCFRIHTPSEKIFSWWDYRMNGFKRNLGLRIDHVLASAALSSQCVNCYIDKTPRTWERPSDHAPVVAEFQLASA